MSHARFFQNNMSKYNENIIAGIKNTTYSNTILSPHQITIDYNYVYTIDINNYNIYRILHNATELEKIYNINSLFSSNYISNVIICGLSGFLFIIVNLVSNNSRLIIIDTNMANKSYIYLINSTYKFSSLSIYLQYNLYLSDINTKSILTVDYRTILNLETESDITSYFTTYNLLPSIPRKLSIDRVNKNICILDNTNSVYLIDINNNIISINLGDILNDSSNIINDIAVFNNTVYAVTNTHIYTSSNNSPFVYFAGNGSVLNYDINGIPLSSASFINIKSIYISYSQNILVADSGNCLISLINNINNTISNLTLPGVFNNNGGYTITQDGVIANETYLNGPCCVFTDTNNNIYICEQFNKNIRIVDAKSNIISTIPQINSYFNENNLTPIYFVLINDIFVLCVNINNTYSIQRFQLNGNNIDQIIFNNNINIFYTIAYDTNNNIYLTSSNAIFMLYSSDNYSINSLHKLNITGVTLNMNKLSNIVFDSSNNIYYCDSINKTVNIITLQNDGSYINSIIAGNNKNYPINISLSNPTGISNDQMFNILFFIDIGINTIYKIDINSNVISIIYTYSSLISPVLFYTGYAKNATSTNIDLIRYYILCDSSENIVEFIANSIYFYL